MHITLFFLLFSAFVFGQTIEGTVIDATKNEKISIARVQLISTTNMLETLTDNDGKFKFIGVSPGIYSVKVHRIAFGDTTFHNIIIKGDTKLKLNIHKCCKYDASVGNKTCPICHKKDKAIPIEYGLLISTNGDPMKDEGVTFIAGGCKITNCDPHWYCKRDSIKF